MAHVGLYKIEKDEEHIFPQLITSAAKSCKLGFFAAILFCSNALQNCS